MDVFQLADRPGRGGVRLFVQSAEWKSLGGRDLSAVVVNPDEGTDAADCGFRIIRTLHPLGFPEEEKPVLYDI